MTKKKKKKYSLGTGRNGVVRHYIESPSETNTENDIMLAKARETAADNPWAKGLDIFGAMALKTGMGMAGGSAGVAGGLKEGFGNIFKGAGKGPTSVSQHSTFIDPATLGLNNISKRGATSTSQHSTFLDPATLAFGGTAGANVEVEGDEVAKLPDGGLIDFVGPDHEKGGIDVNLPEGTDIFSKRITVGGETMAERELKRTKQDNIIAKLSDGNEFDMVLKNTLKRTKSNNAMAQEKDKRLQEVVRLMKKMGETPTDDVEFKDGGTVGGNLLRSLIGGTDPDTGLPIEANANFTGGDLLGLAGTMFSAFEPMKNTEANRAGDTPNINAFEDFGNDALDRINEAKGFVAGQRDKALGDVETARTRSTSANRKTARGVNQMRALDLASDVNANKAEGDIYDNFTKQMMGLISKQAGFENQQDAQVMTGEATRDDADRRDRDQYYSNLAKDIASKGEGIQTLAKMANQNKKNTVSENLLNEASEGYIVKNGRVFLKDGTKELSITETIAAAKAAGFKDDVDAYLLSLQNN